MSCLNPMNCLNRRCCLNRSFPMECYAVKWETGRIVSTEGIVSIEVVSIEGLPYIELQQLTVASAPNCLKALDEDNSRLMIHTNHENNV